MIEEFDIDTETENRPGDFRVSVRDAPTRAIFLSTLGPLQAVQSIIVHCETFDFSVKYVNREARVSLLRCNILPVRCTLILQILCFRR